MMKYKLLVLVMITLSVQARFTQVDPHWAKYPSFSPYNYTGNNPLRYVDPNGLWRVPVNGKIAHNGHFSLNNPQRTSGKHLGTDYQGSIGTQVVASENGRVVFSGYSDSYGNVVYINNSDGTQTRYAHLKTSSLLKYGQEVTEGNKVGEIGQTGNAKGQAKEKAHVHFETRTLKDDLPSNDPNGVINSNSEPKDPDKHIKDAEDIQ